jgi:hypothetical protein
MPIPYKVRGIPLIGGFPLKALVQEPIYVSSTHANASDDSPGTDPDQPNATLAGAFLNNRVSTNGLIVLAPGHTEAITAAAGIVCDIAGVHVLGLGEGTARPTFNFTTAAGADIDIDAANITFENLYFDATGVDALTGPIDVNAAYFSFKNCQVLLADSGGQCADFLVADANADYMLVIDSLFEAGTNAGPQSAIQFIGGDHIMLMRNVLYGDFAASPIENVTTAATRVFIEGNDMDNYNANDFGITLVATTDGTIRYNTIRVATDGQLTFITTAHDCQMYENYGVNNDSETGVLEGTASA